MRKKKGHQIIQPPITNEERSFSNFYCYCLFWVAIGYYLWKKILCVTGYRFHPTDFELLHYYLHNKCLGRDSIVQAITELEDICGFEPWELPGHSNIHSGDEVWYFFYRPKYKFRNSTRINRTTDKGYWKPTGNPREIMARDMETVIGKKRTLVFYKGRFSDNIKNKTGWIMHEYELSATLPGQTTFTLCKLKRKYGKGEVSYIGEGQSSQYLPPNLENYIANNPTQAEAARSLTDQLDRNQILAQLEVINGHEGLQFQSAESWNSYEGSDLPFNSGDHVAENETPNYQLLTEIPIEQEIPQDQLGPSEQDSKFGNNVVPANERSNQHNFVTENDGSTMPCNSINDTADDSLLMDLSNLPGQSMDEVFARLEPLSEVKGNRFGEFFDDISADGFQEPAIPNSSGNQSRTNEEQNLTAANGGFSFSFASMMEQSPPHAINPPRKRSRTDYEGFGWDM